MAWVIMIGGLAALVAVGAVFVSQALKNPDLIRVFREECEAAEEKEKPRREERNRKLGAAGKIGLSVLERYLKK